MAGLYIHIPFCVRKCDYCDFVSFPEDGTLLRYVPALLTEIALAGAEDALPHAFDTVFFGGGTPSLLSGGQLKSIMERLRACFSIAPDAECSLECNPGTATPEKLSAYREAGINRLSIGMQSHDDALLKGIGRIHTFARCEETVRAAKAVGFDNLNLDVMHALPGQTQESYLNSLRAAESLGASHISAYALILEEGTPLYRRVRSGETALPDEDEAADMEDAGFALLKEMGYARYEISNFARAGRACHHNLNYWQNGEYLGLGVAAHSAARLAEWTRWSNMETLDGYLRLLARGRRPVFETIRLFQADEMFECVMLGLRLVCGIDRAAFYKRFGMDVKTAYPDAVAELRRHGWLSETHAYLALNEAGLDMQNAALQCFMR